MNWRNYFDYVYYRTTQVYTKWDGNHGIRGVLLISLIQALIILGVISTTERFSLPSINSPLPQK